MEFQDKQIGEMPATGKILIANPFLKDPNFMRSVVFLYLISCCNRWRSSASSVSTATLPRCAERKGS